ncbi:MAG: hypothetical protein HY243_01180 [Proteobacteria bacterium]|nr:hypothetical protein [Pseudomonadota bacterium]
MLHPLGDHLSLNPIEQLACAIQKLPREIRWLYAQPGAIRAQVGQADPDRGSWGKLAARILDVSAKVGLARTVAAILSLILLLQLSIRQMVVRGAQFRGGPLFVGIGALREPDLLSQFDRMTGLPSQRLDEFDISAFMRVLKIDLRSLLREWRAVVAESWLELSPRSNRGLSSERCLTFFVLYGFKYVYYRAWFRRLIQANGQRYQVAFSAASYVSHAATVAGVSSVYFMHGFQRHSTVYPDFEKVVCFDLVEANHIQQRLPGSSVALREARASKIVPERVVAIAAAYGQTRGYDHCSSFIEWARSAGIPVVIRTHPQDKSGYWQRWREADGIEFTPASLSFEQFIDCYRPCILLTWYSTTLFDALCENIVPATLVDDSVEYDDVVFPFREVSLHWPAQREIFLDMVDSSEKREVFLSDRRALLGLVRGTDLAARVTA